MGFFCDCGNTVKYLTKEIENLRIEMHNLKKINSIELSEYEKRLEAKIQDEIIQFAVNYKAEMEKMRNSGKRF